MFILTQVRPILIKVHERICNTVTSAVKSSCPKQTHTFVVGFLKKDVLKLFKSGSRQSQMLMTKTVPTWWPSPSSSSCPRGPSCSWAAPWSRRRRSGGAPRWAAPCRRRCRSGGAPRSFSGSDVLEQLLGDVVDPEPVLVRLLGEAARVGAGQLLANALPSFSGLSTFINY